MRKIAQRSALLLLLASAAGCAAGPRYVAASTGSKGTVKFLYVGGDGDQGVVKCDVAEDGDLSNCRSVELVLEGG